MISSFQTDISLIAKGGFSFVYKLYNSLDNNYYAIKKIGIKQKNLENT